MPRKTMDAYLADLVKEAVQEVISPILQEIQSLKREISALKNAPADNNHAEKLIPQKEAKARLGVNETAFRRILEEGTLAVVRTPNGRPKVLESSLNAYIRELQEKVG